MTYERYIVDMEIVPYSIVDLNTGDDYPIADEGIFETVCGLLNEQYNQINDLQEKNKAYLEGLKELEKSNNVLRFTIEKLREQNGALKSSNLEYEDALARLEEKK